MKAGIVKAGTVKAGTVKISTVAMAAILIALVVVLGVLQHRWLGALGRAETVRLTAGLESGARAVARDVDRLLADLVRAVVQQARSRPEAHAQSVLETVRQTTVAPGLIRAIWRLEDDPQGPLRAARFDESSGRFVEMSLPPGLTVSEPVFPRQPGARTRRNASRRLIPGLHDRPPAIVIPVGGLPRALRRNIAWLLELDSDVLTNDVLELAIARHLPPLAGNELAVRVERTVDGSLVYANRPGAAPGPTPGPTMAVADGAVTVPMFRLDADRASDDAPRAERPRRGARFRTSFFEAMMRRGAPAWRLVVHHPEGSLEAVVGAARRRNLALAFAVLGLLAASIAFLAIVARRAQSLADERLALVAAVTHELRTPLAAVRSAGANLADGVVAEGEHVKRYGAMIEREGRRLSRLVEQTLALSGASAGSSSLDRRRLAVVPLVESVVAAREDEAERAGMSIAIDSETPLDVIGDGDALYRALDNLIENAIRYASDGGRIDIRVAESVDGFLSIEVGDRGPGVSTADRGRLFEPFFRGRRAGRRADGATREAGAAGGAQGDGDRAGVGLGLAVVDAIVRAHGGRVELERREGGGALFRLLLPKAEGPSRVQVADASGASDISDISEAKA